MARYLDAQLAAYDALQNRILDFSANEEDSRIAIQNAYKQAMAQDPNLPMPSSVEGSPSYEQTTKYLLNKLAQGNYRTKEEVAAAIDGNPLLAQIFKDTPDQKALAAEAVFTRANEKYAPHKTYSLWLDEDPRKAIQPATNPDRELTGIKALDNALYGAWDTTKDLVKMPFEVLGMTDKAKNHKAQADLAQRMTALGRDTTTGMQKLYTLEELRKQKKALEDTSRSFGTLDVNSQQTLELINSKIQSLSSSFSQAELEAINRNGAEYDRYKKQRDELAAIDPDVYKPRYKSDVEHERERADLEMSQLFHKGNADIFNLDNLAYDWDLAKSYLTTDQLAYFAGMMLPWAIGAEYTGSIKLLNGAASGVTKAIMNMGKTPEGRSAIAHAFGEIGKGIAEGAKGMATPLGALQTASAASSYAGAYASTGTDYLNTYFNRENTLDGFNQIEAGLYAMAEHFANFYGGHIAGKAIPASALKKFYGEEISKGMAALRDTMGLGNDGALANAAITNIMRKMMNPAAALQALSKGAFEKAESIGNKRLIQGKGKYTLGSLELMGAGAAAKGGSLALSNAAGVDAKTMLKAGISLATDNTFANIARQKGEGRNEINWNEVGKSAIEGLVAGAAGHLPSMAVGHARAAIKRAEAHNNGFYDSDEVRTRRNEELNSKELRGTKQAVQVLNADLTRWHEGENKVNEKLEGLKASVASTENKAKGFDEAINFTAEGATLDKTKIKGEGKELKKNVKDAEKLVKEYNQHLKYQDKLSQIIRQDDEELVRHSREYFEKNGIDFTDSVFGNLLTNTKGAKVKDYDEASGTARLKQLIPGLTDAQAKRIWDQVTNAKVTDADTAFGEVKSDLTKEASESDEEFAARQKEDVGHIKRLAYARAQAMGQDTNTLDDLQSDEVKALARGDFAALQKSLQKRIEDINKALEAKPEEAKKVSLEDEIKRLERLKKQFTEERAKTHQSEVSETASMEELEQYNLLPTEQALKDAGAELPEGATLDDLKKFQKLWQKDNTKAIPAIQAKAKQIAEAKHPGTDAASQQARDAEYAQTYKKLLNALKVHTDLLEEARKAHNELVRAGTRTQDKKHDKAEIAKAVQEKAKAKTAETIQKAKEAKRKEASDTSTGLQQEIDALKKEGASLLQQSNDLTEKEKETTDKYLDAKKEAARVSSGAFSHEEKVQRLYDATTAVFDSAKTKEDKEFALDASIAISKKSGTILDGFEEWWSETHIPERIRLQIEDKEQALEKEQVEKAVQNRDTLEAELKAEQEQAANLSNKIAENQKAITQKQAELKAIPEKARAEFRAEIKAKASAIKKEAEAEARKEYEKKTEAEVAKAVQDQLDALDKKDPDAHIKDHFEVKTVTFYEGNDRVTKGYIVPKASKDAKWATAVNALLQGLTNGQQLKHIINPASANVANLSQEALQQAENIKTVLEEIFKDPSALKKLKQMGYGDIKSISDLEKLSQPIKIKLISALNQQLMGEAITSRAKAFKAINDKGGKGSVFEHYMTGHKPIKERVKDAFDARAKSKQRINDMRANAVHTRKMKELGVDHISSMDASTPGCELTKFVFAQLRGRMPLDILNNFLKVADKLDDDSKQGFRNALEEWAQKADFNDTALEQISWLENYFKNIVKQNPKNADELWNMHLLLGSLRTLLDGKTKEKGIPFLARNMESFAHEKIKLEFDDFTGRDLYKLNNMFEQVGIEVTEKANYAQLDDWSLEDLLKTDPALLTSEAKRYLMGRLNKSLMDATSNFPTFYRKIFKDKKIADTLFGCFSAYVNRGETGNKSYRVIDSIIENAKAANLEPACIAFLEGLARENIVNDSKRVQAEFDSFLSDTKSGPARFSNLIGFLLTQVPVLGALGLLPEVKGAAKTKDPYKKYRYGSFTTNDTEFLKKLHGRIQEIVESVYSYEGTEEESNSDKLARLSKQDAITFMLLNNINEVTGASPAWIQNEFIWVLLNSRLRKYSSDLSKTSLEEVIADSFPVKGKAGKEEFKIELKPDAHPSLDLNREVSIAQDPNDPDAIDWLKNNDAKTAAKVLDKNGNVKPDVVYLPTRKVNRPVSLVTEVNDEGKTVPKLISKWNKQTKKKEYYYQYSYKLTPSEVAVEEAHQKWNEDNDKPAYTPKYEVYAEVPVPEDHLQKRNFNPNVYWHDPDINEPSFVRSFLESDLAKPIFEGANTKGTLPLPRYTDIEKFVSKWVDDNMQDPEHVLTPDELTKKKEACKKAFTRYLTQNYGEFIAINTMLQIKENMYNNDGTLKDTTSENIEANFRKLSNAISHREDKITHYLSHERIVHTENTTKEDLPTLLNQLLNDVDDKGKPRISKADLQEVLDSREDVKLGAKNYILNELFPATNTKGESLTTEKTYLTQSRIDNFFRSNPLTDEDLALLSHVLADAINKFEVKNSYLQDTSIMNIETVHTNVSGKSSIDALHNRNKHIYKGHSDQIFRKKTKQSVLTTENGIDQFRNMNANSSLADNIDEVLSYIDTMSRMLAYSLKVDTSGKRTVDQLETFNGEFNKAYLDVVAACALKQLDTISGEITEEYFNKLLDRYSSPAVAMEFKLNEYADMDVLTEALGMAVARSMGYEGNTGSPVFDKVVMEAGQHALTALALGGYIELLHISKENGKPVYGSGPALANTVRAVKVTRKGKDTGSYLSSKAIIHDINGSRHLLDLVVGADTINDTRPSNKKEWEARQEKLEADFDSSVIQKGSDKRVFWDHNSGIVAVNTAKDLKDKPEWFYMSGKAVTKTDRIAVSDERLYQLALKSKAEKWMDSDLMWTYFQDFFEVTANGDGTFSFRLRWNEAQAVELCNEKFMEDHPAIAQLIGWNESEKNYGDTSELTEPWKTNLMSSNQEKLRKVIKDARFLAQFYKDTLEKTGSFGKEKVAMYYDEINTVNNRAFVSSIIFNYREYWQYRTFTNMNRVETRDINNKVSPVNLVYPLLYALGLKHDKLPTADSKDIEVQKAKEIEQVRKTWDAFVDIQVDIPDPDGGEDPVKANLAYLIKYAADHGNDKDFIKNYKKLVKSFAEAIKEADKKDQKSEHPTNQYRYEIVEPNIGGSKIVTKAFTVEDNMEALTSLVYLSRVQFTEGGNDLGRITDHPDDIDRLLKKFTSLGDNDLVRNYEIKVEIDGATNGPAIKEHADSMHLRNNTFDRFIVNGVGLNPEYASIMSSQLMDGTLDTYLLNSAVAQEDLNLDIAREMIINNYNDDPSLDYLKTLYGIEDQKCVSGFIDIMANILSRNMMKKPVMVTGYEAGRASVLLKMAMQFDLQASKLFYKNGPELREWLIKACNLNGGRLKVRVVNANGASVEASLDAKGNISTGGNIFDAEYDRRHIAFQTYENVRLNETLNKMLAEIYDSMCKIMKAPQTPFEMNGEASQAMAETINTVLYTSIAQYMDEHGDNISYPEFEEYLWDLVDDVTKKICTIFPVGNSNLQTIKRSVAADARTYLTSMTCTYNDRIFMKTNYKLANYESLGAGEVPMVIHSYDSEIMHTLQQFLEEKYQEEFLAVHDAIIVDPKGADKADSINRGYYQIGYIAKKTFAVRDNALLQAAQNIMRMENIPEALRGKMYDRLMGLYKHTSSYTLSLIYEQLNHYQEELGKDRYARKPYNQYNLGAHTAYYPTDKDLEDGIKYLREVLDSMLSTEFFTNEAIKALPDILTDLVQHSKVLENNEKDQSLILSALLEEKNNALKAGFIHTGSKVEDIIDAIMARIKGVYKKGSEPFTKEQLQKRVQKALNKFQEEDPYAQILNSLRKEADNITKKDADGNNIGRVTHYDISKFNSKETATFGENILGSMFSLIEDLIPRVANRPFSVADDREIRVRLYAGLIRALRENPTGEFTAETKLRLIHQVVGDTLGEAQGRAFRNIASSIKGYEIPASANLDTYDQNAATTFLVSDDLDYEKIASDASRKFNRGLIKPEGIREPRNPNKKATFEELQAALKAVQEKEAQGVPATDEEINNLRSGIGNNVARNVTLTEWFENKILNPLKEQFADYDGQVILCMNSHMDELKYRALMHLKNSGDPRYSKLRIVILPLAGNITKDTPRVANREISLYVQLQRQHAGKFRAIYDVAPGTNKPLLSIITNQNIDEANLVYNTRATRTEDAQIYVPDNTLMKEQYAYRKSFAPDEYQINMLNEKGSSRGKVIKDAKGNSSGKLDQYVLRDRGVAAELATKYEFNDVASMSDEAIIAETNEGSKYQTLTPRDPSTGLSQGHDSLSTDLLDENSVMCLSVTSNGDIIDRIPYSMTQEIPMFSEAYTQFKSDLLEDLARYNRNEITWEEYLRPRVVLVNTDSMHVKRFVFQVTQDVSFTRAELQDVVELNTDYRGTYAKEVIRDTAVSSMLNNKYLTNPGLVHAFTSKFATDNVDTSHKRVPLPMHMLNSTKLGGISSDQLNRRNAAYLNKLTDKLVSDNGITGFYFMQNKVTYDPVIPMNLMALKPRWINVGDMNANAMQQVNNELRRNEQGLIHNLSNRLLSRFMPHSDKMTNAPVERINRYAGHGHSDFDIVRDMAGQALSNGHSVTQAIRQIMAEDQANGIDVSHLAGLANMLSNLSTNIILYIDRNADTIRNSMERWVQEPGRTREEIYLAWGRPTESKTEAFLHELCHTIFNHLPKDSVAYKQALDLFNYVQRNFTINNFEDGDTLENRAIMDAIFSAQTQDNLAEFMVYAMTNQKFQRALRTMHIPEKLQIAMEARTTGVFNRIVNTLDRWLNGKSVPAERTASIMPMIGHIFNAAMAMNNSYWNETNKTNLKEWMPDSYQRVKESMLQMGWIAKDSYLYKILQMIPFDWAANLRGHMMIEQGKDWKGASDAGHNDDLLAYIMNEVRKRFPEIKDGFVNDLLATLEGASKDQFPYLELRMKGKHIVDWYRNQAANAINNRVKEILKDFPSKYEKKLTDYFVRADVSCLFNSNMSEQQIHELLVNDEARKTHIASLEQSLKKEKFGNFYINAAKGLASYLTTGLNPTGLAYRNAYEIVALSGSSHQTKTNPEGAMVRTVDQLATLYAVQHLHAQDGEVYRALTPQILKDLSVVHNSIKQAEFNEVYGDSEQKNHIPKGQLHGGEVKGRYDIIPESQLKAYEWNGYQKEHDAKLDPFYTRVAADKGTKYVIVSAHNKNPVPTVAGCTVMADIFKGRGKQGLSFNHENDLDKDITFRETQDWQKLHRYVNSRIEALNKPNPQLLSNELDGNLVLNFNFLGDMNGANFELNPITTDFKLGRETKITSVLGDLYGSIQERSRTPEFNKKVGEAAIEIYENASDKENFVWITENSENQDYRDFWDALPFDTKQVITESHKYKDKGLPVRRKALNTFFGYRHLSSNDTKQMLKDIENEKLNLDKLSSSFSNFVRAMFYNKHVGFLEQKLKWMAATGKENIVIKGITTSFYNVMSNCVTLKLLGLDYKEAYGYQIDALKQIKTLADINQDLQELHVKRIEKRYTNQDAAQERVLLDRAKALPIYPLIEAGAVANTLAEDLTETDRILKDFIDNHLDKGMLNSLAHTGFMTPKSFMYNLLKDFASLGDSTGKYALYTHMVKKGMEPREALRQATNTFIDYSNPLPKEIQFADDLGVLPFMKFGLGIQTTILNTLTKHPDEALGWVLTNAAIGSTVPDIFQSVLGIGTITDRLQPPGGLFIDSLSQLPSVRITNTLMENL